MSKFLNYKFIFIASFSALVLAACGPESEETSEADMSTTPVEDMGTTPVEDMTTTPEEDQGTTPVEEDMGSEPVEEDMGSEPAEDMEPDLDVVGDLGTPEPTDFPCFTELKEAWPLNESVNATGSITADGDAWAVDAAAGGRMEALNNSFVYVDFDSNSIVETDDVSALTEGTWDIAFKRVAIRINGGTSGEGQARAAKLTDTSFEDVSAVPTDATFVTDESVDAECTLKVDPVSAPYTAFNALNVDNPTGTESWYSYGGPGGVAPTEGVVYLVENAEGSATYKLAIDSWASGVFTLRWAVVQ